MKKEIQKTHPAFETLPQPGRILIADDDAGICDIYSIIFQRAGYEFEIKSNGIDLLNNKFILPDLFLIDKQLSGYDGLEICRFLKTQKRTKRIPVIMISATPGIGLLSTLAGADGSIEKPFDIKFLLDTVKKTLQRDKIIGE